MARLVKSFPAIPNMPWFADILLNLCVCGARTTHNQQTQPSQPAIALTKNTNKNSLHDPPGIVVEIVGTDAGDRGRTCEEHPVNCGVVLEEDVVAPYFFY